MNGADLWTREGIQLVSLADVSPERIRWLWVGRIPFGMITLLNGDPEAAKSLITIDIAARLTTGRSMPGDDQPIGTTHVIVVSTEDHPATVIRPRFDAAGADVTKVSLVKAMRREETSEPPSLSPAGIVKLKAAIVETGSRLVVIDPLMNYIPADIDSHKDQDIRRVLSPLTHVAEETGAAILIVRHHTKSTKGNHRGEGSIGIKGVARVELTANKPGGRDHGILTVTKSNIGPYPQPIAYQIVDAKNGPALRWDSPKGLAAGSPVDGTVSVVDVARNFPGLKKAELAVRTGGNKSMRLSQIDAAVRDGRLELREGKGKTLRGGRVYPTGP